MKNAFRNKKKDGSDADPPTNYRSFTDDNNNTNNNSNSNAVANNSTDTDNHNNDSLTPVTTTGTATADYDANYRGFSTSIYDMFSKPENERTDCCALTCCGVLQSDRDRFLLQGVSPPSPFKRCGVHILLPLFIFLAAGYGALHIQDRQTNQIISSALVLMMVGYFFAQCYKGRSKRIEIRKDLLWTKYQLQNHQDLAMVLEQERPDDDDGDDDDNDAHCDREYYLGQSARDFFCAHPACMIGCYPADHASVQAAYDSRGDNLCSLIWASLVPPFCGMHPQLFGLCAIAQEAREVEHVILPSSYRRIDYITMQPVMEYYPAIYRAKCQDLSLPTPSTSSSSAAAASPTPSTLSSSDAAATALFGSLHMPPLSRLSTRLLQTIGGLMIFMLVWSVVGPLYWKYIVHANVAHGTFAWPDFLVFVCTWLQALGLLTLLAKAGNRHKNSQLSVDAMIKFFASGFLLSTSLAIFWELIVSLVLRSLVSLSLAIAGVDVATNEDGYNLGWAAAGFASNAVAAPLLSVAADGTEQQDFIKTFGHSHPAFYTIFLLLDAFIMAALVEELCKYFGYRMVEHPDFFSKRDLEEAARVVYGDTPDELEQGRRSRRERPNYTNQNTSLQAQGAAITIAMVAVAMGFTCCENLVYIFIYNGSSVEMELWVLVVRSFFPVHAITAAMQSVGVCERDLEASRATKLGRIVWPAILFHGGYDFLLLWIDFMAERQGLDDNDDADAFDSSSGLVLLLAFVVSILTVALALVYYFKSARKQRQRLIAMDRQELAAQSRLI